MNIPKERAKELYRGFYSLLPSHSIEGNHIAAKRCSTFAVDEMIESAKFISSEEMLMGAVIYLQKVKQEIDKL